MPIWLEVLLAFFASMMASTGLWAFIQKKNEYKDARSKMILGIGHDRIVWLGTHYLDRGDWITKEEYDSLVEYLYKPYKELGGNGTAEKVIEDIKENLRIVKEPPTKSR